MKKHVLFFVAFAFILTSCVKDGAKVEYFYYPEDDYKMMSQYIDIPAYPESYTLDFPSYYTRANVRSFDNGMAVLGRVLFYDKNLSSDRTISCASCHDQQIGFSDDVAFSQGVSNRATSRNSLPLGSTFNFAEYYGNPLFGSIPFFWDNRAFNVAEQSKQTLGNPLEMDMHMSEVVERVKSLEYYKPMFDKEFGQINENSILAAISEFVNSIGSFETKFDKALEAHFQSYGNLENLEGKKFVGFNDSENRGKDIYMAKCASCHSSDFGAPSKVQANNGLKMVYEDEGIYDISSVSTDKGHFKIPTLRNITLTAPYMHDGSLATLSDVIDHYSSGIQGHAYLSPELISNSGQPVQMNFSNQDKQDLIAFLTTLEDEVLKTDKKFSDPFIK